MSGGKMDPAVTSGGTLESVFAALEARVSSIASRSRGLSAENDRLRAALGEAVAEAARLRREVEDLREGAVRKGEDTQKRLQEFLAERDDVRSRVERLVASLEDAETVDEAGSRT